MPDLNSNLKGVLYALTGFAIFASHDAVIKFLGLLGRRFTVLGKFRSLVKKEVKIHENLDSA